MAVTAARARTSIWSAPQGINTLADFRYHRDLPRAERHARRRPGLHWRGRRGPRRCRPDRHCHRRCRYRRAAGRCDRLRSAAAGRQGRQGRLGQHQLQEQHAIARRARRCPGLPGEKRAAAARAEGDGRRRPARIAECRQIDPDPRSFGGEAESCRLSVHDAAPESGRGCGRNPPQLRHGRHSGADRGRRGGRGPRHPLPQAPAAHARAAAPGRYRAAGPGCGSRARCPRDRAAN